VIREVIRFRLPLGPRTDEFLKLLGEVHAGMKELGVEPGRRWTTLAGERVVIVEREFLSLAAYEADDERFHGGPEFMALWRRMEACALSMDVELWESRGSDSHGVNTSQAAARVGVP
jgi:hypothetical protein